MAVQFEIVCGPKFMTFWEDVGPQTPTDPLWLPMHLTDCLNIVFCSEVISC